MIILINKFTKQIKFDCHKEIKYGNNNKIIQRVKAYSIKGEDFLEDLKYGSNYFHTAIENNNWKIFQHLFNACPYECRQKVFSKKNSQGLTPFHLLIYKDYSDIELFKFHFLNFPQSLWNLKTDDGKTPLMLTLKEDSFIRINSLKYITKYLNYKKINYTSTDKNQNTFLISLTIAIFQLLNDSHSPSESKNCKEAMTIFSDILKKHNCKYKDYLNINYKNPEGKTIFNLIKDQLLHLSMTSFAMYIDDDLEKQYEKLLLLVNYMLIPMLNYYKLNFHSDNFINVEKHIVTMLKNAKDCFRKKHSDIPREVFYQILWIQRVDLIFMWKMLFFLVILNIPKDKSRF